MSELLVQAKILKIDNEALLEFFVSKIHEMVNHKPNFNVHGHRCWVIRGFYPETTLFFKLSLLDTREGMSAKASPMRVKEGSVHANWDKSIRLDGAKLNEIITNNMENAFFGADHKVEAIFSEKIKMPRCMSPKGMKLLRYKKPRKKKDEK